MNCYNIAKVNFKKILRLIKIYFFSGCPENFLSGQRSPFPFFGSGVATRNYFLICTGGERALGKFMCHYSKINISYYPKIFLPMIIV
jgi:hypothetical protein